MRLGNPAVLAMRTKSIRFDIVRGFQRGVVKSNRSVDVKPNNGKRQKKRKREKKKNEENSKSSQFIRNELCFPFGQCTEALHEQIKELPLLSTGERFNVMVVIYNYKNKHNNMLCTYMRHRCPRRFLLSTRFYAKMFEKKRQIKLIRSL